MKNIEEKISEMFNRIEIFPPYSPDPIIITQFSWNQKYGRFQGCLFFG
ncbi:hypothetical protein [Bacillus sp. MRMR6]|nr:hypothetical protein [Bacillus sp. MRMR6]